MNLFEEVGLLPEVFDPEHYEDIVRQQMALYSLLSRLRSTTLIRAVEAPRWETEAGNRCRSSLAAKKVFELLKKEGRNILPVPRSGSGFVPFVHALSNRL